MRVGDKLRVRATWLDHDNSSGTFGQALTMGAMDIVILNFVHHGEEVVVRCSYPEFHDEGKNYRTLKTKALKTLLT